MSKKVMCEISIQHEHPILYNDYSICELVKNSKLSNFSIKVVNDICTSFGLELSRLIKFCKFNCLAYTSQSEQTLR